MEYFTTLYNADIQRYESLSCSVDISLDRWIVSAPRFINWKWWTVLISRSSVPCILYGTYSPILGDNKMHICSTIFSISIIFVGE